MANKKKVLIVDDHSAIRAGLVHMLSSEPDMDIVGEAVDGQEAIEKAVELKPDVIIMDIFMPRCTGLEATLSIKERLPETKILIFTVSEREQDLFQALRFGAEGFILKETNIMEIPVAVRSIYNGETILSPLIAKKLVDEFRHKSSESSLSSREGEVIELLGNGLTNSQIAERLFISEATVRTYLNRLLTKLHLKNRAEAIAYIQQRQASRIQKV
jgi:DNA-binding NarL/FixJ family response regulator